MKTLFFTLCLLIGITACQSLIQDVDPGRLPAVEPQLVVHCYVSPQDTLLVASVSLSRTSVGVQTTTNPFNALPNAVVTLAGGNRSVSLVLDSTQGVYRADPKQFPIRAGQTYTLTVRAPGGLSATATTTVPALVPINTVQLDSSAAQFQPGLLDYFIRLRWSDPAGIINFYHVAGDNEYGSTGRVYQPNGTFTEVPFQAVNEVFFRIDNQLPYLTDENRDGQNITSPRGRLSFNFVNGIRSANPPVIVNAYLMNVDEAYYRYHQVVRQQNRVSDNPFAEPVLVSGNIQGAFGCFGSYSKSTQTLKLK